MRKYDYEKYYWLIRDYLWEVVKELDMDYLQSAVKQLTKEIEYYQSGGYENYPDFEKIKKLKARKAELEGKLAVAKYVTEPTLEVLDKLERLTWRLSHYEKYRSNKEN